MNSPSSPFHLLRFCPLICTLDFGFWREVNSLKLIDWRLNTPTVPITGFLVPLQPNPSTSETVVSPPPIQERSDATAAASSDGWRLHLEKDSLTIHPDDQLHCQQHSISSRPPSLIQLFPVQGLFFNANSAEDFRTINRQDFIHQITKPIIQRLIQALNILQHSPNTCDSIPILFQCTSSTNSLISYLTQFFILSYADLKSHLYYYNVALPTFRPTIGIYGRILPRTPVLHTLTPNSFSLPFSLNYLHLASIGEALLGTTPHRSSGFTSICVLIRRKQITEAEQKQSDTEPDDWLSLFLNHNSHNSIIIDSDTAIVSLWNILMNFHLNAKQNNSSIFEFLLETSSAEGIVCVIDAARFEKDFGWPLRSILFALGFLGFAGKKLNVLAYRDRASSIQAFRSMSGYSSSIPLVIHMPHSHCFTFNSEFNYVDSSLIPDTISLSRIEDARSREPIVSGWLRRTLHKEDQHSSSITFLADLRRHLNPIHSQADAVHLNIRLIQWRILPSLEISKLQNLRFLFLGVGTLGCNLLRILVAWGVTQFTLVDSGRVALSSPVRQSLYLHEDAIWNHGGGRLKVVAAKQRLLQIRPDLSINETVIDIPMPGHSRYLSPLHGDHHQHSQHLESPTTSALMDFSSTTSAQAAVTQQDRVDSTSLEYTVTLLERLIDAHDVVLLLTDSRESRWLPSMLAATRPLRRNSNLLSTSSIDLSSIQTTGSPKLKPPPLSPFIPFNEYYQSEHHSDPKESDKYVLQRNETWNHLFTTLPTFSSPLCITVALGFDSFVVMRHGQRQPLGLSSHSPSLSDGSSLQQDNGTPTQNQLLACYFCNDLTAPADSLARRPFDQQCTVTRPGVSALASSVAAELIAAISQHPQAPDVPHSAIDHGPTASFHSCLGATPHTIRGGLGDFHIVCTGTEAFAHCICCSLPVAHQYCSPEKFKFLNEVIARSELLEKISGLASMKGCHREDEVLAFDDLDI